MISRLLVGAITVALYPTTAVLSLAVQYLAPDPFADPEVRAYLERIENGA